MLGVVWGGRSWLRGGDFRIVPAPFTNRNVSASATLDVAGPAAVASSPSSNRDRPQIRIVEQKLQIRMQRYEIC